MAELVSDTPSEGMCKDKCGRPKNKWTSYCNECYNRRKKERYNLSQAKMHIEQETPATEIPAQFLQASVEVASKEIVVLRQMLRERNIVIERLCSHLDEYRPDLASAFRESLRPKTDKKT